MSLLDQFERETVYNVRSAPARADPYDHIDQMLENIKAPSASAHLEQQSNMFSLERVDYRPKGLIQMRVCNGLVIMALENGHLIRLALDAPQDLEDIDFTKKGEMIHSLHLDPTGTHTIIAMESKDIWYLHASWPKPKILSRVKGMAILLECVAWDMQNTDKTTTGDMLFGASDGRIIEVMLDKEGKEKTLKPVYNLNDGGVGGVRGLHYERFPSEPHKFFIMATTATRIYQFIGGPTFEAVFTDTETHPTTELPGELPKSELRFYSKSLGMPRHFAWLSGPGIFHGNLVFGSQNPGDTVATDTHLLPYPSESMSKNLPAREKGYSQQAPLTPVSLGVTEFHFLLVYEDRFTGMSILNNQVVYEEMLGRGGPGSRLVGMTQDLLKNTIWVYGEDVIYQVLPYQEDRYVWKLYLDKGLFEEALQHCKNPKQRDIVWTAQADSYFAKHVYGLAAEYYGKTNKSFEEVALKFIEINEREALKTFLMAKLRSLGHQDVTQKTAICTWVTEIYLNKLNQLHNAGLGDQHEMLREEFATFLGENLENMDKQTTINLIQSHGRGEEFLVFCGLLEDYERVIDYHVQHNAFDRAIAVLSTQTSADLYYKFSPILMTHKAVQTVNAWMTSRAPLNARKLIPALMRYKPASPNEPHQGIRYLEYCVDKLNNEDPAIHNYLLSLYAEVSSNDDRHLIAFLSSRKPYFDLKYALRLCTKHNKPRACVLIYSAMGLYEEAVDLALEVDLELAKVNADKPNDDELRKKLWLRIARQVVEKEKDIKKAMAFLRHCELLKIEDILPFFPDFVLIDDFKDEICGSLEEYNRHIDELKKGMDEATESANLIRQDIKALRNKYGFVGGNQKCDLCNYPVLARLFYLFPCQHVFHADCLRREVTEHLSKEQFAKVRELEARLARAEAEMSARAPQTSLPNDSNTTLDATLSPVEQCKGDLDDMIAAECIHCGDIMINSISLPFFDVTDEAQMRSWAL